MDRSIFASRAQSLNARVAAVTLVVGAFMILLLSHISIALAPLHLIALSIAAFAVWAFADEMGIRKPLNRAGLVAFSVAAFTKVQITLGVEQHLLGRYLLLYAAFLLLAVLFWSVALLHRRRELKVIGAVGVLATVTPIAAIVIGHVVVGSAAILGVGSLLAATQGYTPHDLDFVTTVERIFGLWSYAAAWLLWRGYIENPLTAEPNDNGKYELTK